jgi:hypothetical protein
MNFPQTNHNINYQITYRILLNISLQTFLNTKSEIEKKTHFKLTRQTRIAWIPETCFNTAAPRTLKWGKKSIIHWQFFFRLKIAIVSMYRKCIFPFAQSFLRLTLWLVYCSFSSFSLSFSHYYIFFIAFCCCCLRCVYEDDEFLYVNVREKKVLKCVFSF